MRSHLEVLYVLSTSDLQARYGRGGLRVIKWLLDPVAALGVYLVLVALVLDRGGEAIGLSLACAIVPFQFLVTAVINSLGSISGRGSILVNMQFPRILLPLASAATESAASAASLLLIPVMMLIYGVGVGATILWIPVALALIMSASIRTIVAAGSASGTVAFASHGGGGSGGGSASPASAASSSRCQRSRPRSRTWIGSLWPWARSELIIATAPRK